MASLGLGLVDPGLVDIYRVGPDTESSVQQDVLQRRTQSLPQVVLTASMTVEVDQHLDDSGVTCDHFLGLLHLQSDISRETRRSANAARECSHVRSSQSPDLVSQRLSEQLQQQEGLPAVGAIVKKAEHQHLHEGRGATLRHQEDQLGQVQGLSLKHAETRRCRQTATDGLR